MWDESVCQGMEDDSDIRAQLPPGLEPQHDLNIPNIAAHIGPAFDLWRFVTKGFK